MSFPVPKKQKHKDYIIYVTFTEGGLFYPAPYIPYTLDTDICEWCKKHRIHSFLTLNGWSFDVINGWNEYKHRTSIEEYDRWKEFYEKHSSPRWDGEQGL